MCHQQGFFWFYRRIAAVLTSLADWVYGCFSHHPSESELRDWESLDEVRYNVYRHFWERGYYSTSGIKFGVDFLVYEGKDAHALVVEIRLYVCASFDILMMQCSFESSSSPW